MQVKHRSNLIQERVAQNDGLDTVRADTFFGMAALEQDALSEWEKKALVFENAQAPSPWTVPSVTSLFTSLYPSVHGVISYTDFSSDRLPPGAREISTP